MAAHPDLLTSWLTLTTPERVILFTKLLGVWGCAGIVAFDSWWLLDRPHATPGPCPPQMSAYERGETKKWECLTSATMQRWITDESSGQNSTEVMPNRGAMTGRR